MSIDAVREGEWGEAGFGIDLPEVASFLIATALQVAALTVAIFSALAAPIHENYLGIVVPVVVVTVLAGTNYYLFRSSIKSGTDH